VAQGFQPTTKRELSLPGGRVIVEMDEYAMLAAASLYPNETDLEFDRDGIVEALSTLEIVRGIENDYIDELIARVGEGEDVLQEIVARGQEPVDGKDAYLEYPLLDRLPEEQTESGEPVHITKYNIVNSREGETVAIYHPLVEGKAGWTVDGRSIPVRQATDTTAKPGQNVKWEDRNLVSAVDGRLVIEERQLYVLPTLEFEKDLTLVHGKIDFVGKIVVNGTVEAGQKIRCEKDMVVGGSIIGSSLDIEGSLTVGNGIVGSEDTSIEVGGNLEAVFVENANLHVHGTAKIRDSLVTSRVVCTDTIDMIDGRGHFVSGLIASRNGIRVRSVGIPVGTKTKLCVGKDPLAIERREDLKRTADHLEKATARVQELEARMGPMTKTYQSLPLYKRNEIELLLEQLDRMLVQQQEVKQELQELEPRLTSNSDATITVLGAVFVDTIIDFPLDCLKVTTSLKGVTYRYNEQTGKIEALDAGDEDSAEAEAS